MGYTPIKNKKFFFKLYMFNVYNLINSDISMYLWNHQLINAIKHIYHTTSKSFLSPLCVYVCVCVCVCVYVY